MGGHSWVTLATNDSYSLGALVLAHSLKQVGTKQQLTVLITPGVTQPMRSKLAEVFNVVQEVNILDSKDEANLQLLKRPELGVTFTKLHCWRLTQFDKCVFLDADTLVLENCDELFDREELSAAPDIGWPDCFNSGVFVFRPSNDTYEKLVQFALEKGSFDGGDQGLLNLYFSDWAHKDISKHLPFIYNMASTACYSYLPAFKQFGGTAKIIHFIGSSKPWLQYFDTETKQVHPTQGYEHLKMILQHWWDIFCSLIHPHLSPDMAGIAGAFAKLTLGQPRTPEQLALDDHLRRQGWEVGNIDYLGRDSFDNIWNKICETLSSSPDAPKSKVKTDIKTSSDPVSETGSNELKTTETEKPVEVLGNVEAEQILAEQISASTQESSESPQDKILFEESDSLKPTAGTIETPKTSTKSEGPPEPPKDSVAPETSVSIPETPLPVTETPKPSTETPKPTAEAPKPTAEAPKPITEEPKLTAEEPKPTAESPKPTADAPKPTAEAPKPTAEAPKPTAEAPKPTVETPKPTAETPKPTAETPKPTAETPKPTAETPKPTTEERKLTAEEPKPPAEEPKPPAEALKPSAEGPKPNAEAPKPIAEAPKPIAEAPKPTAEAPEPTAEAPKSTTQKLIEEPSKPIVESTKPVAASSKPDAETPKAATDISHPVVELLKSEVSEPSTEPITSVVETPKTDIKTSKPLSEIPKQVVESSKPVEESSKKQPETPKEVAQSPKPVEETSKQLPDSPKQVANTTKQDTVTSKTDAKPDPEPKDTLTSKVESLQKSTEPSSPESAKLVKESVKSSCESPEVVTKLAGAAKTEKSGPASVSPVCPIKSKQSTVSEESKESEKKPASKKGKEAPKTEVTDTAPPTSPLSPQLKQNKQALSVDTTVPDTPPPTTQESTTACPTPPPRKGSSGAKKTASKTKK